MKCVQGRLSESPAHFVAGTELICCVMLKPDAADYRKES